jgi:hypothetical protein
MKLLLAMVAVAGLACAAELAEYKAVYVLPMSNGLDQYLAIKLTTGSVMQVVTDPQKADVVFTDRIGASFEQTLDDLYGQKPKSEDKDKDKDSMNGSTRGVSSPLAHGKGLMFLVDRRTRNVVWSTYVKPKGSSPDELNHVAAEVAGKLDKDKTGKKTK